MSTLNASSSVAEVGPTSGVELRVTEEGNGKAQAESDGDDGRHGDSGQTKTLRAHAQRELNQRIGPGFVGRRWSGPSRRGRRAEVAVPARLPPSILETSGR
jgi:hypothetical protein